MCHSFLLIPVLCSHPLFMSFYHHRCCHHLCVSDNFYCEFVVCVISIRVAILAFLRPNFSILAFFHVDLPEKLTFGLRLTFGLFWPVFSNISK